MERRNFFRLFAGGAAAAIITPSILSEEVVPIETETTQTLTTGIGTYPWDEDIWRVWYDRYGKDFNVMDTTRGAAK